MELNKFALKVSDYKAVFESDVGIRVLYDLMQTAGFNGSIFNENPYILSFNEGKRDMVMRILTMCGYDMAEIHKRMTEASKHGHDQYPN
jgi:hypothetical protein